MESRDRHTQTNRKPGFVNDEKKADMTLKMILWRKLFKQKLIKTMIIIFLKI